MLVLTRRAGQGICIGDNIRVTVVAIDGGFVRLGLEAPASYKILRDELWQSVAADNREAATATMVARTFADLVRQAPQPAETGSAPQREPQRSIG